MTGNMQHRGRSAFTLVELLVVIAIIGLLVALLLPAVQSARAASRNTICQSHLRQVALAALNYESQQGRLPPLWSGDATTPWQNFSWRVAVLPYMEESVLHNRLNLAEQPLSEPNLPAAAVRIQLFQCPSVPVHPRSASEMGVGVSRVVGIEVATCDYCAIHDVADEADASPLRGIWNGGPQLDGADGVASPLDRMSAELRRRVPRLQRVRDGLTRTILLIEQAGKPNGFAAGFNPRTTAPTEGAWITAEFSSYFGEGVNVNNYTDPYGFHAGANASFADGSVFTIPGEISPAVLSALLSRDGNEIVDQEDW